MPRTIAICLLLIAATIAVYWPVHDYGFVTYDDPLYVTGCAQVQAGLSRENFIWAFTTLETGNWHPLTWLSHMLDAELFHDAEGMPTAGGPHMVNVALHGLSAALVFLLLLKLTGAMRCSAIAAAIFALHPLRVESVAWVAERKDVLSTFFGLLAMIAYVWWARSLQNRRSIATRIAAYACVIVLFCVSLLAKPMLVTLPVLMMLLDWWPLKRLGILDSGFSSRSPHEPSANAIEAQSKIQNPESTTSPFWLVIEKTPLFAMSAASSVITVIAQHRGGSVESLETLSVGARVSNAVVSYARYLEKTFVPVDLAVLYPHPSAWPPVVVIGCAALLIAITFTSIALARRAPYLLMGWLWFVIALLPVIGLVQVGAQSIADRYSYVPSIGLYIAIVWAARDVFGQTPRPVVGVVAATVIGLLAVLTRVQVHVWSDSMTLYAHALASTRDNWIMELKLGTELEQQSRFSEAHPHFINAARLRPKDVEVQFKVGDILARQGRFAESIVAFRHVLTLDPDNAHALNNLAWLLASFPAPGEGDASEAVHLAQRAVELTDYQDASFLDTLALAHAANGRFDEAIRIARSARDLARQRGQDDLANQLDQSIERYLNRSK